MSRFEIWRLTPVREAWTEDAQDFLVELHAELRARDQAGGDAFRVIAISPGMLVKELASASGCESGRGYLFLNDYDERVIRAWLQRLVERSAASDWVELKAWIERHFDWLE